MADSAWTRAKELFEEALERPAGEREAFLKERCGDDTELLEEVRALLASYADTPTFFDAPAAASFDAPEDGAARSWEGREVGPFKVERLVAAGGMGAVYLGRRTKEFDQTVAIKFLHRGFESGEARARFVNERQTLAHLRHRNIASLLDGGTTEDGLPYLVMEYVEGRRLDDYCAEEQPGTRERLELFLQVCDGVEAAHRSLVVHRDLKPGNVLVEEDGVCKLLDFGIAKILEPSDAEASAGLTVAPLAWLTPEYASPEQIRGDPVTTASDVYSLGVMLYELLTGVRPYAVEGRSRLAIEKAVTEQAPTRPSRAVREPGSPGAAAAARDLEGDLDAIVMMAMRKEPERRYASVAQFADDLRRHLRGLPVAARPDTLGYRASKFVGRHKVSVGAGALLLLTLLGGIFATSRQARIANRKATTAARATEVMMLSFERANPMKSPGEPVTAAEVLQESLRLLEEDRALRDEPEIRFELELGIGRAFLGLHEDHRAVEVLEDALASHAETGAEADLARADVLLRLCIARRRIGEYERARAHGEEALAIRRKRLGPEHPETAQVLNALGVVEMAAGELDAAGGYYEEARRIRAQRAGEPGLSEEERRGASRDLAISLNNLGALARARGELEEGATLFEEALIHQRAAHGESHPEVATNLNNLGMGLYDLGRLGEAEERLTEALEMRLATLPPHHPQTATSASNLGLVLFSRGDPAGAAERFEEAVAILTETLEPTHPTVMDVRSNLASARQAAGQDEEAEALFREILADRRATLPAGHFEIGNSLRLLGDHLLLSGQPEAAEEFLREYAALVAAEFPKEHWSRADADYLLGLCLADLGRRQEAIERLERAVRGFERETGFEQELGVAREQLAALEGRG